MEIEIPIILYSHALAAEFRSTKKSCVVYVKEVMGMPTPESLCAAKNFNLDLDAEWAFRTYLTIFYLEDIISGEFRNEFI